MTLHFPDEVDDQPADHRRDRPEVGHGRVQGHGDPRRAARPGELEDVGEAGDAGRAARLMDIVLHNEAPLDGGARRGRRRARPAGLSLGGRRGRRPDRDRRVARGGHAARAQRHLLLPALHAVQARVGWISPGALELHLPAADGPAGRGLRRGHLLRLFSLEPQPPAVAHVCDDIACLAGGAASCAPNSSGWIGPEGDAPGQRPRAIWLESPCLGLCERAPAALVTRRRRGAARAVARARRPPTRHRGAAGRRRARRRARPARRAAGRATPRLRLLRRDRAWSIPTSLDAYRARRRLRGAARGARAWARQA